MYEYSAVILMAGEARATRIPHQRVCKEQAANSTAQKTPEKRQKSS